MSQRTADTYQTEELIGRGLESIKTKVYMGIITRIESNRIVLDGGPGRIMTEALSFYRVVEPRGEAQIVKQKPIL